MIYTVHLLRDQSSIERDCRRLTGCSPGEEIDSTNISKCRIGPFISGLWANIICWLFSLGASSGIRRTVDELQGHWEVATHPCIDIKLAGGTPTCMNICFSGYKAILFGGGKTPS